MALEQNDAKHRMIQQMHDLELEHMRGLSPYVGDMGMGLGFADDFPGSPIPMRRAGSGPGGGPLQSPSPQGPAAAARSAASNQGLLSATPPAHLLMEEYESELKKVQQDKAKLVKENRELRRSSKLLEDELEQLRSDSAARKESLEQGDAGQDHADADQGAASSRASERSEQPSPGTLQRDMAAKMEAILKLGEEVQQTQHVIGLEAIVHTLADRQALVCKCLTRLLVETQAGGGQSCPQTPAAASPMPSALSPGDPYPAGDGGEEPLAADGNGDDDDDMDIVMLAGAVDMRMRALAEECVALQEQLQRVKLMQDAIDQLEEENRQLFAAVQSQDEVKNQRLEQELAELEDSTERDDTIAMLEVRLESEQQRAVHLDELLHAAREQQALAEEAAKAGQARAEELQQLLQASEAAHSRCGAAAAELRQSLQQAERRLAEAETRAEELEAEQHRARMEAIQAESEKSGLEQRLRSTQDTLDQAEAEREQLSAERRELLANMAAADTAKELEAGEVRRLRRQLEEAGSADRAAEADVRRLVCSLRAAERDKMDMQAALREAKSTVGRLQAALSDSRSQEVGRMQVAEVAVGGGGGGAWMAPLLVVLAALVVVLSTALGTVATRDLCTANMLGDIGQFLYAVGSGGVEQHGRWPA